MIVHVYESQAYTLFALGTDIPILREQALKKSIATVFRRLWLKNLYYHLLSTLFVKDNLGMGSCLTDSSWYDKVLNSSCLLFYKKCLALASSRISYMGNLTAQCTTHSFAWRPSSTYSLTPKNKATDKQSTIKYIKEKKKRKRENPWLHFVGSRSLLLPKETRHSFVKM